MSNTKIIRLWALAVIFFCICTAIYSLTLYQNKPIKHALTFNCKQQGLIQSITQDLARANTSEVSLSETATLLQDLLTQASSAQTSSNLTKDANEIKLNPNPQVLTENSSTHTQPSEMTKTMNQLSDVFLFSFINHALLAPCDIEFAFDTHAIHLNNLPSFLPMPHTQFDVYHADDTTRLFAARIKQGGDTYYIAFNYSWDMHDMPLPFGFMASTKVQRWESDIRQLETFVTNHTIKVRPFTAVVLKV